MSTANVRQDKDSGPYKNLFFFFLSPLATNGLEMIHQLIEYLLARSPTNADPDFYNGMMERKDARGGIWPPP
jgi:hypothetical protein